MCDGIAHWHQIDTESELLLHGLHRHGDRWSEHWMHFTSVTVNQQAIHCIYLPLYALCSIRGSFSVIFLGPPQYIVWSECGGLRNCSKVITLQLPVLYRIPIALNCIHSSTNLRQCFFFYFSIIFLSVCVRFLFCFLEMHFICSFVH